MGVQTADGRMLSSTVTVAVQVAVLSLLSVTVRITGIAPKSVHVKLVLLAARLLMPQASVELLSSWAGRIVACPEPSSCMVIFWQTAPGGVTSCTVTFALQVAALP